MGALKEAFTKLVDARFIKRAAEIVNESEPNGNTNGNANKKAHKIPMLTINERTMFLVPNIAIPGNYLRFIKISAISAFYFKKLAIQELMQIYQQQE